MAKLFSLIRQQFKLVHLNKKRETAKDSEAKIFATQAQRLMLLIGFSCVLLIVNCNPSTTELKPGSPVKRGHPGRTSDRFEFTADKGQFIFIEVAQNECDVAIHVYDKNKQLLRSHDSDQGDQGREVIALLAPSTGRHLIEVQAENPEVKGSYTLRLDPLHLPAEEDRHKIRASRLFSQGVQAAATGNRQGWETAKGLFEQAGLAWSRVDNHHQQAVSHWHRGLMLGKLKDGEGKLAAYKQVAELIEKTGDSAFHATTLFNIGSVASRLNHFEEALTYFNRCLALRPEPTLGRASVLQAIAFTFRVAGDLDRARTFLLEAELIQKRYGNASSRSRFHDNFGAYYLLTEQTDQAIFHLEKSIQYRREAGYAPHPGVLDRLAQVYALRGDFDMALHYHERSLNRISTKDDDKLPAIFRNYGSTLYAAGKFQQALPLLEQAVSGFQQSTADDQLLYALFTLALVEHALGRREQALEHVELALQIMDDTRNATQDINFKFRFTSLRYAPVELLAELVLAGDAQSQQELNRFFEKIDALRSANMVSAFHQANPNNYPAPDITTNLEELAYRINEERRYLASGFKSQKTMDLTQWLQQYDVKRENRLKNFARPPETSKPPNFKTLTNQLREGESDLLYYILGKDRVYLLTLVKQNIQRFDLGPKKDIEADVRDFKTLVQHQETELHRREVERLRKRLGRLLPEAAVRGSANRRVAIVPDGFLHLLPFAALAIQGDDRPFASEKEIIYLPSLGTLHALKNRPQKQGTGIAVVADPFTKAKALPFSRLEANFIQTLFPKADLFLGKDARKDIILQGALNDHRLLHFATHGFLHPQRYELSALLLADEDSEGGPLEKYLRVADILTLNFSADLVVLGACDSGLGEELRSEGPTGLPQAFLQNGVRAVLVSLWRIDDEATQVFMKLFYQNLVQKGLSPGRSLQLAQISMSTDPVWEASYYWAGFRLLGDWDAKPF